jgi:hypothetical protein
MAQIIPAIPYKERVLDQNGYLSTAWIGWFRQLFLRVGGIEALSNTELENLPALDLAATNASVTALQTLAIAQGALISTLQGQVSDLNQGPTL